MISDGIKITLSDSLTFESGSSELLPKAKEVLEKVAEMMTPKVEEIEVQGHTDDVPIARDSYYRTNWHLGAARAVSVVQYLHKSSDLDPSRFKATSFGEYRPVVPNDTPEGRLRNRRVEIYLRDKVRQEDINPFEKSFSLNLQERSATF
jgi:chemotaxis protein MotB